MKLISILYSLLTLPLFGLIEYILLPLFKYTILLLKAISVFLDDFNYTMVKINTRLAQESGRVKCKHPRSSFLAPGYPDYQEGCQLNAYRCLDCKEVIQKYDEI